jgi:hypothetical protein
LIVGGIVLLLAACGGPSKETAPGKNTIQWSELTEEQREIVNLLSNNQQELQMYTYQTEETFKTVDVWLEIYKDGKLLEPRSGGVTIMTDKPTALTGKIAVMITQTPDYQWTFTIDQGQGEVSSRSELSPHYLTSGHAYGPYNGVQEVKDGQEILLHASVFSGSDSTQFSTEMFINTPETVKNYPYVHLIKAKFSK